MPAGLCGDPIAILTCSPAKEITLILLILNLMLCMYNIALLAAVDDMKISCSSNKYLQINLLACKLVNFKAIFVVNAF